MEKLSTSEIGGNCFISDTQLPLETEATVRLNDTISAELEVFSGVPQGSILGRFSS